MEPIDRKSEKQQKTKLLGNYSPTSIWTTYLCVVPAAWVAEIATYPVDLVKTRMQTHGEGATTEMFKRRGMFGTMTNVIKTEGFFKLWHGIVASLFKQAIYGGTRVCGYAYIRERITEKRGGPMPMWMSAMCAVGCGVVGQALSSPTELLKTQVQMEGKRKLEGKPPRVHGLLDAMQQVIRKGGIRSLWNGTVPNMQRGALVTMGDIGGYDVSKRFLMNYFELPDNFTVHVMSSFCAGFIAALFGTPADVIKTRMMNQPIDENGRGITYSGTLDCYRKTIKLEGASTMYRGFMPLWLRVTPWALVFWVTYEQIRRLIGVGGF